MPISRQVRRILKAISPRLAISSLPMGIPFASGVVGHERLYQRLPWPGLDVAVASGWRTGPVEGYISRACGFAEALRSSFIRYPGVRAIYADVVESVDTHV